MELKACRLCLDKKNLAPLFGRRSPEQFTINQVFLATGVVILPNDDLPQEACIVCIKRLKSAIHLRNISTQTQEKLKDLQKTTSVDEKDIFDDLLDEIDNNFKTDDKELNKFVRNINTEVGQTVQSLINCEISQLDNEFIVNAYEKDTFDNLLHEIDNFKTDDKELNKFLRKINTDVCQVVQSSINSEIGQLDNEFIVNDNFMANSNFENEFIVNDNFMADSNVEHEIEISECSQVDNSNYQIHFEHNYHQKSSDLSVVFKKNGKNKNKTNNLKIKCKVKKNNMEVKKIRKTCDKDNKLYKKLKLLSSLKKNPKYSNPAMLPAKQFKLLFAKNTTEILKKEENSNNVKINSVSPLNCNKTIKQVRLKKSSRGDNKRSMSDNKISRLDNEMSLPDNKSSLSDHSDIEEDLPSLTDMDDWYKNYFADTETQQEIKKRRLEKFKSLAVTQEPVNGKLKCRVCRISVARTSFVSHAKLHFPPEFSCESCGKTFHSNGQVRYHRQRVHGQERKLGCHLCDFKAVWKKDLEEHIYVHTGERPYECDICRFTFRRRLCIVQHMRIHFKKKVIQCPRCPDKWFRCRSDVGKHMRNRHCDFEYFCHVCPMTYYGYSGRASLRKHLLKVHGIPRSGQPVKLKYTKTPK